MNPKNIELYRFLFQAAVSSAIMLFAMVMLLFHPGKQRVNEALYASMLSGIAGWWLPSPTGGKKESNIAVESEITNISANSEQDKPGEN